MALAAARRRGLSCLLVAAVLVTLFASYADARPAAHHAKPPSYSLRLRDDDTGAAVSGADRKLLTKVHRLLEQDRWHAVVGLIPAHYRAAEKKLFRQVHYRTRVLLLMSTYVNDDTNSDVYPGFVRRCASGSDYSKYDLDSLKILRRHYTHAHPCGSMRHYKGVVVSVGHWTSPRSRFGKPYFRGITLRR